MKHNEKWYQRRLARYFDKCYSRYEDTVEFYVDPAVNQWLFYIPERKLKVKLTCDDDSIISVDEYEEGIE